MNFLAHFHLSAGHEDLIVGALLAEVVKGGLQKQPEPLRFPILLHRKIDVFSDEHPAAIASQRRLRPLVGHYAPVVVDVLYDHFLARFWEQYESVSLEAFAASVYVVLRRAEPALPPRAGAISRSMRQYDWLGSYRSREGIIVALQRMSTRLRRGVDLSVAGRALEQHDLARQLESDFLSFFPSVQQFVRELRDSR